LLADARSAEAVEVAERFADGLAGADELMAAEAAAVAARNMTVASLAPGAGPENPVCSAARAAASVAYSPSATGRPNRNAWVSVSFVISWAQCARFDGADRRDGPENLAQCSLIRDIFGNPFRRVSVDPSWLKWGGGTIAKLAATIYAERAFDRLPVLADALEDAGCTDAEILGHCRSGGEHVRGCWAVDLLLGRG
jgi:hypothetical protein